MTAKLLCTSETAMHRAMQEKQYSEVTSNAKVLIKSCIRSKNKELELMLWEY